MKQLLLILLLVQLTGCAMIQSTGALDQKPVLTKSMLKKEFDTLPPPATGKSVSVAVYGFTDKTGQRRPQANVASLSMAVTQGGETFLIQALQNVSNGKWFDVVERVGIDNLTKERTIIRQMREAYEGPNSKPLMPMQFAGMIIEGGIVGYDASTNSGGAGMRIFGIGKQTQWSSDTVTVSLRAVSVNTGKVLATVTVQKSILSTADSTTALKFFDQGTQAFEAEAGLTINEPGTYAVKATVEMAVVELIKEGARKGVWAFKYEPIEKPWHKGAGFEDEPIPPPPVIPEVKKPEPVVETAPVKEQNKIETKPLKEEPNAEPKKHEPKVEVKKEPVVLFGKRVLKQDSYLYTEHDEQSTKKWQFKKGTKVDIRQPGTEGWVKITDSESRGGWIRTEQLEEIK
jgi:curli production assembly/transport component CsgG